MFSYWLLPLRLARLIYILESSRKMTPMAPNTIKKRAYLVDSSIYIFRGWHVYPEHMTDIEGHPTNAVYGFTEFLHELIQLEQPEYIACAFDAKQTHSYRREIYPDYKANRPPAPEELKRQFKYCRDFCRAAGIADFSSNRYEADDIIGTLATQLRENGYAITIISADKDLAQLIKPGDIWWDFARDKIMHYRDVEKIFGVKPELIADLLALSGDAIDNVPGIPGIGYKMASNLLKKYPSVEHIVENVDQIAKMKFRGSARIQRLVEQHKHILPMTKQLTTIVTDAEFRGPKQDLRWHGIDEGALQHMFKRLNAGPGRRERWLRLQSY
jgi:5'-3' exonuclease